MTQFQTEGSTLKSASTNVREVSGTVQGQLGSLQRAVEGVAPHWQGDAHTAFQNLMTHWSEDATKLKSALEDIASLIDTAHVKYNNADASGTSTITKAGGGLNAS